MLPQLSCRLLSANPLVAIADDFFSQGDCERLIGMARGKTARAGVGTDRAVLETSDQRTNFHASLNPVKIPEIRPVMQRFANAVSLPVSHGEGLSVLHYQAAEEFKPHVDGIWSGASAEAIAQFEADGGQRLFTAMVYLNRPDEGGATAFPELGIRVAPHPGRLLIFANTAAGSRDATERAIHAGEPVTSGEKWAAVSWWRERPFSMAQTENAS